MASDRDAPPERPVPSAALASALRISVLRLGRRLRRHAPADLTPAQLSALAAVRRDVGVTLSGLAEHERVQPPTMTRIVDALVAKGLVERSVCPDDRRVSRLRATPAGRELVDGVRRRRDAYLASRLAALTDEERAVLARAADLLDRLGEGS
ncbi:MAG: MarR family winged helix-turn-helix transcriptional regulator [Actinomycetota bacterium]